MRSEKNHVRAMHEFHNFPVSIKCFHVDISNIFVMFYIFMFPQLSTSNSFLLLMFLESESPDYSA